jgi:hypothetical protein
MRFAWFVVPRPALPRLLFLALLTATAPLPAQQGATAGGHRYNGPYTGRNLDRVAFPIGGLGAGMVCLEGTGGIAQVSVRNRMQFFHEPCSFAALCVVRDGGNVAKVLEGPVPTWKVFGAPRTGNGAGGTSYGLPRFDAATFQARFPFATVTLADAEIPLAVELCAWSPFVPGAADDSSLPTGALEYRFENTSAAPVQAVFSYHTKQFLATSRGAGRVLPIPGGFVLHQAGSAKNPEHEGSYAVFVDGEAVVDHCWFHGGWWDALTLVWRNIERGALVANPPTPGSAPGASLYVPLTLAPGEARTVRLLLCWYVPETDLRYGKDGAASGPAFGYGPSAGTADNQQAVSGFQGAGLVNTYDPLGDGLTGTLTSAGFRIEHPFLQFLVGGGSDVKATCVELIVDGEVVRAAAGRDDERLELATWDLRDLRGKTAQRRIADRATGAWGHVNVDLIVAAEDRFADAAALLAAAGAARQGQRGSGWTLLHDFEGEDFAGWTAAGPPAPAEPCCPSTYRPWYAGRFASLDDLAGFWRAEYARLRSASACCRDAFYDSTLPAEVLEAVAANLTILKSPTVLRQTDGRLWCFEGCSDDVGCCPGSCTHVWNYAQAIPHLFPDLERTLRETEFLQSQDERGHQTFRAGLPIRPVDHTFHAAADGQLGGIMKVHRDWLIAGDSGWLRELWPAVKQSLDYCITTWDPRGKGALEEPHHNTYDIEYWGPDGHCSSFYLGALQAAAVMGKALGEDVARYEQLATKGRAFLEQQLYNGEYFFQKIQTAGLDAKFTPIDTSANGPGYADVVAALNAEGPKYQYGTGCLSDGVLGFWMARVCGLEQELVDPAKVKSSLAAIHRYNLKTDLADHANPQRPSFALGHEGGLLLCTWPRGGELAIPFVYSDEVWTGIEYQVASHLMLEGMVEQGLEIVRVCRDRYDGAVRNPFDEYECGHWYARALSSYGLLQGLTGARYDALDKTLHIDSKIGDDFRSFLATAGGFGTVGLERGEPFLEVRQGAIEVARVLVSGKEKQLRRR